ncbi:PAN/Apple domain containing protein [Trema orientale]|uniref:PAN/Apple domain containing protein n=1 Tax=Trema orientale TaxID=63057 RepID=A0A2P5D0Y7_TREOI|nr:PAN/Apple domain containing protein [Trema orientale]
MNGIFSGLNRDNSGKFMRFAGHIASAKNLPFCRCLMGFQPKSQSDWNSAEYSDGCFRTTKLQCGNRTSSDKFLEMRSVSFPEDRSMEAVCILECESTCLHNCSCIAYAHDNNSCSIWMTDLLNL